MPLGTMLIASADPKVFKLSVGILILVFSSALYLNKRPLAIKFGGRLADGAIGFAGGILGGLAGLSGPLPILWANIRGWNKHERRGIFQLFNFTVLSAALVMQTVSGIVELKVIWLAAVAFPGTLIGARCRRARLSRAERQAFWRRRARPAVPLRSHLVWNSIGAI